MPACRLTCSFAPSRFVLRVVGKHWITADIRAVRGSALGAPPVDGAESGQGGAASKDAAADGAGAGEPADGPIQLSELDTPGAGVEGAADERTLLMCAAEAGLMRAVKTLIRMRADVSARDVAGATAAEIASAVRARPHAPSHPQLRPAHKHHFRALGNATGHASAPRTPRLDIPPGPLLRSEPLYGRIEKGV